MKIKIKLLLFFILIISAISVSMFFGMAKYKKNLEESLSDKYNLIMYNYLKPNRKFLLLDFNTKKTVPVDYCPYYTDFSNWFQSEKKEYLCKLKNDEKNITNKKVYILDNVTIKLKREVLYKNGLCIRFFDNEEIKGTKTIYLFDYDNYGRLKSFKDQYTYDDEIRTALSYEYKYIYDFFSKTLFVFKFDKHNINTVFYIKKTKKGYCISSFKDLLKNQEPSESEYIHYNATNFILEKGLIKEIHEIHYNYYGISDVEYLAKFSYSDDLKTSEELLVKRKEERDFKTIFKTEYQYNDRKVSKQIQKDYDKWDRKNKEVSNSVSYNFVYDSHGNEILYDYYSVNLRNGNQNNGGCKVKTEIEYE